MNKNALQIRVLLLHYVEMDSFIYNTNGICAMNKVCDFSVVKYDDVNYVESGLYFC